MGLFDFMFGGGGEDYAAEASKLYDGIKPPSVEELRLNLEKYVQQGALTPEQAEAILVESNAYESMDLDTIGKDAQMDALLGLQEVADEGGLTATDRAKLQRIQSEEQSQSRGAREAILQNAQARGAGGSGLEILNQLTNAQDSATRQSQRDLDVAAMAQERALQALQAAGQMGGQINQQQFGQQQAIADSKNEIAKFNANNRQNVNLTNTAANNAAAATNLKAKQDIANSNVDLGNKQQQYNTELGQQNFQNQMAKAQGKSGALTGQADQANKNQQNNKSLFGTLAGAGATLFSDERVKKDVEKFDAGEFLDSLTGYKYKYKDPSMGEGQQVGPMAQDLEREVPQMVEDTPRGKTVDYSPEKAGGPIMAGLADLNERLRKLEGR